MVVSRMSKLVEKLKKNICRYLVDHRKTDLAYKISPSYTTVILCEDFSKGFEEGVKAAENGETPTKEAFETIDNLYTNIWGFYGMLDEEEDEE